MLARVLVAVLGLAVIAAVQYWPVRLLLESHLHDEAVARLAAEGIQGVDVEIDGVDAVLSGADGADELAASRALDDVDGIAALRYGPVTVPSPTRTTAPSPTTTGATTSSPVTSARTPAAPPATTDADDLALVEVSLASIGPITFERSGAVFTPDGADAVAAAARVILDAPEGTRFRIEAHTDTVGEADFNKQLSVDRANAVRLALIDAGVPGRSLQAVGYGEERPLVTPEESLDDRVANRRVEIAVLP